MACCQHCVDGSTHGRLCLPRLSMSFCHQEAAGEGQMQTHEHACGHAILRAILALQAPGMGSRGSQAKAKVCSGEPGKEVLTSPQWVTAVLSDVGQLQLVVHNLSTQVS